MASDAEAQRAMDLLRKIYEEQQATIAALNEGAAASDSQESQ